MRKSGINTETEMQRKKARETAKGLEKSYEIEGSGTLVAEETDFKKIVLTEGRG